jgi:hypothetical protein
MLAISLSTRSYPPEASPRAPARPLVLAFRDMVPAEAVERFAAVRYGTEVGSMTAFALLEALTQTEEGRVIMESLRRILAQTSEAPQVTEEDGT